MQKGFIKQGSFKNNRNKSKLKNGTGLGGQRAKQTYIGLDEHRVRHT